MIRCLTSLSAYQDNETLIMKGSVQWRATIIKPISTFSGTQIWDPKIQLTGHADCSFRSAAWSQSPMSGQADTSLYLGKKYGSWKGAFFFNQKELTFYLFLHKKICCGYSLEVPHRAATNEYPQHRFSCRNKKKINLITLLIDSYETL